ncbi:hypothetical protein HWB52_gp13 [Pseudomonas phage Littlefix]|uniref:Uncharacterized protein n=1 Tax=Pseudomonas phage Littlefix TaxID=2079289 RepID=A0A2K9VHR9_9CAUD|nr:hypothetical protein HWB52_gp13 [Pseudomonas phage Littlefix]AUV61828.1 hypothetical protein PsPhLittlefix_gp13 [Pseudomonas phage Littlefix]
MANYFPNLNLGITEEESPFQFGLGNGLPGMSYGSGAPASLAANIGASAGGPTVAAAPASGVANLFSSLFADKGLFSQSGMFGGLDDKGVASGGWVGPAAGIASTIFGAIQGNKQLSMAEDRFKESKRQFDANYNAQRQTTNTQLEDRQRARVAANPNAYESVDSYLAKNRIT